MTFKCFHDGIVKLYITQMPVYLNRTVTETWLTKVNSSRSLMHIFSFIFIYVYKTVSPCDCYVFTQSAKPKQLQCRLFCTIFQSMPPTCFGGMTPESGKSF